MTGLERGINKIDLLEEATGGLFRWDDDGMDDFGEGWQIFPKGKRVEVFTEKGWLMGTVREGMHENGRAIVVECDIRYSDNENYYHGRGATVSVYNNTRRGIWSKLRLVEQDPEYVSPTDLRERLLKEPMNTVYLLAMGHLALSNQRYI